PEETKSIEIIINVPLDAKGNYEGKLKIKSW
ncbi:unnamed protein product, partial [marine sediment metagenome]